MLPSGAALWLASLGPCKMRMWISSRSGLESSLTHSLNLVLTNALCLIAVPANRPRLLPAVSPSAWRQLLDHDDTASVRLCCEPSRPRLPSPSSSSSSSATPFFRRHPRRGPGSHGGQGISRLGQGQLSGLEVRISRCSPILNYLGMPSTASDCLGLS